MTTSASGRRTRAAGDANAVVAHNLVLIRERRGWSTTQVLERITRHAEVAGQEVPEATLSRLRRLLEAKGRRRFDAHQLYLLSVGFDVPIAYFFLPPAARGAEPLADTGRPTVELYGALLGRPAQLVDLDERLREVDVAAPEATPQLLRSLFGITRGARSWPEHYRVWRDDRLHQLSQDHGAALRRVARFVGDLADELTDVAREAALASVEAGPAPGTALNGAGAPSE